VRAPVLLVVVIPLIVPACGGGSGEATFKSMTRTEVAPPSRADLVGVADTICRNHQSRREDLESQARELEPIASPSDARRVAALLRQEADNRRAEARELAALPSPPTDVAPVAPLLSLIRAQADVLEHWARAYDHLDQAAIRRTQIQLGVLAGRAARAARADGLTVCGQP